VKLPAHLSQVGAGGELVPNVAKHGREAEFRSTIENPDYVTASASRERLDLANEAGALEVALDLSDTVCAQNSIEQLLAHQIAAAHCSALKMVAQMNKQIEVMNVLKDERRQAANVEATRLAGAVSRLMQTCQQGALTLQRLKTGGRQVVTVQHVNVGHGGQAIVAGQVAGGGHTAMPMGEGVKNGQ
jgi:hypothetical protein